jgi:lactoylglutathione lyase
MHLQHIALSVADVEISSRFYEQALGLKRLPRPDFDFSGAWLQLSDNQELHLLSGRTEPVSSGSRSNHLALEVGNLTIWERHFQEKNIPFRPLKQRPDGAWHLFLIDPDGYFIELFCLNQD